MMAFFPLRIAAIESARWGVLVVLVLAPWIYGGTPGWVVEWMRWTLLGVSGVFLGGLLLQRRWPRCSGWLWGGVLVGGGYGWWMALNPTRFFSGVTYSFQWVDERWAAGPGSYDGGTSVAEMLLITGLCGVGVLVADMMANPLWMRRLWGTVAGTGVSIALLGLIQRATGARAIFWEPGVISPQPNFFGPYLYHANAGAFLNLVLPVVWGVILAGLFCRPRSEKLISAGVIGAMAVLTAVFTNTSRAAIVIGVAILLMCLVGGGWMVQKRWRSVRKRSLLVGVILFSFALCLPWAFGLERMTKRWLEGMDALVSNDRFEAYEVIWSRMVPEAGWWGFGPGTFEITFPFFTHGHERLAGIWKHAHHDYLQLLIEWGWVGALWWVSMALAVLMLAGRKLVMKGWRRWQEREFFVVMALIAVLGIFTHAAFDFPLQIASLQLYTAVLLGVLAGYGALKH